MKLIIAIAISLLPFSSALAGQKILKQDTKEFNNVCDGKTASSTCKVKKIFFSTQNVSLQDGGDKYPYLQTLLRAGFETETWQDAQEYGFVQYLRGCTFESQLDKSGKVVRRISEVIRHYDVKNTFVHPNWTYDANTRDPLYYGPLPEDSNLPGGRLALYRWTPKIGTYGEKQTREMASVLKLAPVKLAALTPRLFVIDTPSMAYYSDVTKEFRNIALEFKMCLYKLKDIPLAVTSETPIPNAIVCYDWDSQFEFNFAKKQYVHKPGSGLNAYCASQVAESPVEIWQRELKERK